MPLEQYVIQTLEIELNRLRYEDRSKVHYASTNENNEVPKGRWERIHALEKAIIFHKKLVKEGKRWYDGNQFNDTRTFWPDTQ